MLNVSSMFVVRQLVSGGGDHTSSGGIPTDQGTSLNVTQASSPLIQTVALRRCTVEDLCRRNHIRCMLLLMYYVFIMINEKQVGKSPLTEITACRVRRPWMVTPPDKDDFSVVTPSLINLPCSRAV